uniref:Protein kinase domain-containing protein n=1 Tax=Haemonchus contortus TaxID=6289 RepID=A0A7I4Z6S8_HAECO
MERLGRMWTRLSVRRPTLPAVEPRPEEDSDDDLPYTKKEVFEMFSGSRASQHRKSDGAYLHRARCSVDSMARMSSSPQRKLVTPPVPGESPVSDAPSTLKNNNTEGQQLAESLSKSMVLAKKHPHLSSDRRTDSFNEESCSFNPEMHRSFYKERKSINVSSRPSDAADVVNSRRSSVFVKRGSVTMDPIKKVNIEDVYTVYKQLGTGRFGYIKLAEHKQSKQKIAIKFFPRPQTKQVDFIREYNYSFFLSPHPQIIDTYEGMHQTGDESAFFFVQQFCPRASLREAVEATNQQGIGEANTKKVFGAVLSAIEFMHSENLVHRNLKAENILLFDSNDFSKAKITDFGLTRKVDAAVKYLEYVNNYHAPELCETVVNEMLTVNKSTDIWALGVIFYYCMKGRFPWQKASIMCKPYWEWEQWLKRKNPTLPKRWTPFSEKALKLMKKTLTPRVKDRWTAKDMRKCIAKEKLLKPVKSDDDVFVYVPSEFVRHEGQTKGDGKKKSTLQHWISTTLSAMAEISEQVVSARDD